MSDAAAHIYSAPAKINLALRVLGRRADGYHLLDTVMVFVDLCDTLHITPTYGPIVVSCDPPVTGRPEENLVYQAAAALAARAGRSVGAEIHIEKRIPSAAGMGGGSSDCGVTLRALNDLWGLGLSIQELIDIGVTLGADVPLFVLGQAALAGGIGEELQPLPHLPLVHLVLVNPGFPLSTGEVFKIHGGHAPETAAALAIPDARRGESALGLLENHLEPAALQLAPQLTEMRAALLQAGAQGALMSGSGATFFGVFADADAAQRAAEAIAARHPQWWVRATTSMNAIKKEK
ncbi:4-(cytidine 5'-diphospho)-2-C-methyl-D-erythritol kinase [Magnetofaba australis]|uniref:4-diphosphocytidyl-2-C-methyl-D-erythritol kinase n=1 Tax=Magnetofaba australis IT-1 TaxID=1434232 RepID=A0A1Y2K7A9_9PROT|nr:4-(cytidine 5'-diphospho)-2-C-methyl-D-erythritol kinase [Magnetofaba australis]OSM04252.1 putative 4-diphosphocytidyl-2-C-methyl-D-erythritol kinase [Magnetofaba australis IT-1]